MKYMKILDRLRKIAKKEDEKLYFKEVARNWLEQKQITIKDLEQYNYNDFVTSLMEDLSAKTVKDIVCILKSILNFANDEYNSNIKVKRIISPKVQNENVTIMSNREKGRLENYCRKANTLKSIGIIVCLNTGLRIGEICSLKWKDIDLEKRLIFVKNTLQRIKDKETNKTKIIIDKPKTQNSIRAIPISNKLYEILLPLKRRYKENEFFLTGSSEKFVEPRAYQYEFKKILKKCRIKSYKFHTLRHYFSNNCIEVGMD